VARLGGDEFGLLLRGAAGDEDGSVLDRLSAAVAEASPPGLPVGVSVGLARLDDYPDVEAALRAADEAMYTAKRTTKARARARS